MARSGGVGVEADCRFLSSSEKTDAGERGENDETSPEEVEGLVPLIGVPLSSLEVNSRGSMTSRSRGVSGMETKKTAFVRDPETL
jgi:hypothetical protein